MCLCGRNVMSHFSEFAVLIENNLTQRKGVDITFSLFIMAKIELYLKNKSWMLLSSMTATGSYSENKLFMPLSPIQKNYPKIIVNNGPKFYCGRLKNHWLQSHAAVHIGYNKSLCTARLLNVGLYEFVDIEIVI